MKVQDNTKTNRIDESILQLKKDIKENKKTFIIGASITLVVVIILTSWLTQYTNYLLGNQSSIYILNLLTAFASNPISFALTIALYVMTLKRLYKMFKINEKDYVLDEEENYKRAKETVYGDAHWQTEEEKKECCIISKNLDNIPNTILGIDKHERIYCLRNDLVGKNKCVIAFGAAGSGKSAALVLNDLMQAIKRGNSVICTDSKGDVYRDTAAIFRKHGYVVKVLNLKPEELRNSDGWEPMKYITRRNKIQAEVLAKTIIENTEDGPMDYWAKNEMNCLKAVFLLVALSENYNHSMSEVIDIIKSPQTFDQKFVGLPNNHPAKAAYDIYAAAKDDVKKQILNGLGIRLSLLTDEDVYEIVSHDEIDLTLPMKRKCIYYIIISDTDTSMRFLSSMFFTQLFMAQINFSDSLTKEQKKKQKAVLYELDEMKNIGAIPFYDVKIATFRSRKIFATMILQGVPQLEDMFPNKRHEAILSNTTTKMLLAAGDIPTAEYFEKLCGTVTTKQENGKYTKSRSQLIDIHDEEDKSSGLGQRPLLPKAKAMQLPADWVIICINGFFPLRLKKFICEKRYPMFIEETKETPPNRHKPKWRKDKEEAEQLQKQRMEELMNNQSKEEVKEEVKEKRAKEIKNDEKKMTPSENNDRIVYPYTLTTADSSSAQEDHEPEDDFFENDNTNNTAEQIKQMRAVQESKNKSINANSAGTNNSNSKNKKDDRSQNNVTMKLVAENESGRGVKTTNLKTDRGTSRLAAALNTPEPKFTKGDDLFSDLF